LREIETLRSKVADANQRSPETDEQCRFVRDWRRTAEGETASLGRRTRDHFQGCLLGGAVGDALGAPVEFMTIDSIRRRYGSAGIAEYDVAYGRRGAITDDTQMTLFTAEGLLRADVRGRHKGICNPASVLHHAYIRWLHTQGERSVSHFAQNVRDGWLMSVEELHARRAPGNTCLSALRGATMGTIEDRLNDSKGCGGVMRVAPVGLAARDQEAAFALGCEAAAITHGHPSGFYSAGCFAAIIRNLVEGDTLPGAIERTLRMVGHTTKTGHEECVAAIRQAVALWQDADVTATPETIERLGGGWVGEEALAIALYCALSAEHDFAQGVCLAVNHSGDSDSTGAITGNLLGVMLGIDAIPTGWVEALELRQVIEAIANDLYTGFDESSAWSDRYPGW
jgi:ADP-ribosylglycohydrolase